MNFQQQKNKKSAFLLDLPRCDPTILHCKEDNEYQHARSKISSSSRKVSHILYTMDSEVFKFLCMFKLLLIPFSEWIEAWGWFLYMKELSCSLHECLGIYDRFLDYDLFIFFNLVLRSWVWLACLAQFSWILLYFIHTFFFISSFNKIGYFQAN